VCALLAAGPAWPAAEGEAATATIPVEAAAVDDPVARGEYVFRAGGCYSCHTDVKNKGPALAGGRPLETPFGTFYTPNITPDPETGIGSWSDADFLRALKHGRSPVGAPFYPAFPYTSYSGMTDRDALDLKAYLFAQEPVHQANKPHDLAFPFSLRFTAGIWQLLFFSPQTFTPDPGRDKQWNRGAYLVRHLAHCGECHTPRNALGVLEQDRALAGTKDGPDGKPVPNITPDKAKGIGSWSTDEVVTLLKSGATPEYDYVGGAMAAVVDHGTSHLTDTDLEAIAIYVQSLPAVPSQ
jgi:mono/diheme cytochrome c family protein